jgi:hypothetical protein
MGFVISQSKTYSWPVEVSLPADAGRFDKFTFDAEFARVTQTRVEEIIKGITEGDLSDRQVCREILKGWRGITVDGTAEQPFSASALDEILEFPTVGMCIVKAWMESISGARRKN